MSSGSRWWEFYFVRYALGTLFGALLIQGMASADKRIAEFLFFSNSSATTQEVASVPLLGLPVLFAYGLAFCYISSIPILTFHAARTALWRTHKNDKYEVIFSRLTRIYTQGKKVEKNLLSLIIMLLVLWPLTSGTIIAFQTFESGLISNSFVTYLLVITCLLVLTSQFAAVALLAFGRQKIYGNLKRLSKARENNENKGGFIDTYRHLREHGNSVAILVLEAILGASLIGIISHFSGHPEIENELRSMAASCFALLILWVTPGASVWFLAGWIESKFAFDSE